MTHTAMKIIELSTVVVICAVRSVAAALAWPCAWSYGVPEVTTPVKLTMKPAAESARPVTLYGPASPEPARFHAKKPVPLVPDVSAKRFQLAGNEPLLVLS